MQGRTAVVSLVLVGLLLGACGPADVPSPPAPATPDATEAVVATRRPTGAGGKNGTITFWSTEAQPERVATTQAMLDRFEQASGIRVELEPIEENRLPERVVAASAAGELPDVIFHPLDFTVGWYQNGILDADAATAAIDRLGRDTFSQGALDLMRVGERFVSLPSDGWGQLLVYRKDLFDAAGLPAPDTYAKIVDAAKTLHDPSRQFYGIAAASKAGEVFTQQTFEQFALANNCQLVDSSGAVQLNSPACVEAIATFADLVRNYGLPEEADVTSTRAAYFAGQAAMVIWSPFILDEMAGLRDNALPTCPECAADPAFLARRSGFVPAFAGPMGEPAQYGQVSALGITVDADVALASAFVEFWFNDGYLDWLSLAPEGKLPMRRGTPAQPTRWIDGWGTLQTGVDRKARLRDLYGEPVLNILVTGTQRFKRWGFSQGQGALVSVVYEALPAPAQVRRVIDGTTTPEQAAEELQAIVEDFS